MKKVLVSFLALASVMLACAYTPAGAAPAWVTMRETAECTYQVDMSAVRFSGEETDKMLDLWIKEIRKAEPAVYTLTHMLVKESMMCMEKERGKYSAADGATISFAADGGKGWSPLAADTPAGEIARQLFAGYRDKVKAFDPASVKVDPQEAQKALDGGKIKHGTDDGSGTKWFYVRDTCRSGAAHMTFDFWLLADRSGGREGRLNFSLVTAVRGSHTLKEGVIVRVGGKDWKVAKPVPKGATSFPWGQTFTLSFILPPSLVQALMTNESGVTVKWYHNSDRGSEYTIPADIARYIGLMYAGCK